jgi:hypothetical protein
MRPEIEQLLADVRRAREHAHLLQRAASDLRQFCRHQAELTAYERNLAIRERRERLYESIEEPRQPSPRSHREE